ncbi:MAG: nuclear transport factor 2 family protein [Pseudomonadales bacterium]
MTDLDTLAARLTALEDIEAIKQLKSCYFRACDAKDVATMRECFADGEVEIEYGRVGSFRHRDQLCEVFQNLAVHEHIVEMHHGQNPEVELLTSDSAKGVWGLYYFLVNPRDQTLTQLGASYFDEFKKIDGRWQITRTECVVQSTLLLDTSEGLAKVLFAGRQAPAAIDDPAQQATGE